MAYESTFQPVFTGLMNTAYRNEKAFSESSFVPV